MLPPRRAGSAPRAARPAGAAARSAAALIQYGVIRQRSKNDKTVSREVKNVSQG